ncbi:MAG: asparagine synthase (glutamine-hydrolyzing) [Acidobacteriota bacterium]
MCGITGFLNYNGEPVDPEVLRKMADAIRPRGPDGDGFYTDGGLGFGHRRLAIIDLSHECDQPMVTADGRYALIFNGEIYNFRELRAELQNVGYRFRSTGDSEVVLNAFVEWGIRAIERFNGMFALAVWDRDQRELYLARDRYGIKPLYYAVFNNSLIFGSEVKAILKHPKASFSLNREALLEYFTFQNLFTDSTLFSDIKLLPAGTYLKISTAGCSDPVRYWDFNFSEPEGEIDEEEYIEELDRLLRQAVIRQLVSDVDVGAYLSGGMDSGAITAIAATHLPYMKSFTCGFDLHSASGIEISFDERVRAERMSYLFKTEHYEMVLKSGDMERVMPRLAWHIEEPRLGQCYPNFYAAQLASKFVKVCLSGGGGDEIFGGYPWRYYRAVANANFEEYIDKYYSYWQRLIPNSAIQQVFQPIWGEVKHVSTRDIFRNVFAVHADRLTRPEDYVNHSLYFEIKTFLHGLLIVEDKMSMAHSLETRVPFLDNDLVDFAMRMPVRMKLANLSEAVRVNENEPAFKTEKYFQRTRDGKLALRRVMSRHIPREITEAEKQGFSAPDASWFKGESIEYVRHEILDPKARIYHHMDYHAVSSLVDEHLTGKQNRRLLIWSQLSFEWWLKSFQS